MLENIMMAIEEIKKAVEEKKDINTIYTLCIDLYEAFDYEVNKEKLASINDVEVLKIFKSWYLMFQKPNVYKKDEMGGINYAVSKYPLLSREENITLAKKAQSGDAKAKDALVCHNLRLVLKEALYSHHHTGVEIVDLFQMGVVGLLKAVDGYDVTQDVAFTTYASVSIRSHIWRGSESAFMIHQPYPVVKMHNQLVALKNDFLEKNGRPATMQELGKLTNLSAEKVEEYLGYDRSMASLDAPLNMEEDNETLISILTDDDSCFEIPDKYLDRREFEDTIKEVIKRLPKRDKDIIYYRFGFYDNHCYTLREVAEILHLSRESIRQKEQFVLKKLKGSRKLQSLN